ncbi:aldose 1-epimerase family protein [Clostridium beijerinckii]|uniref:aldose 1-epimerase family protein n=1 Tax=Clostridium beijerinckii TaxID=1520 RepID=UPI0012B16776|nr:aldose 1-epimerase family protein [Clostridium beijerinckii]MRY42703.1 DUF4432 family protein [Parabacteroides distasonis]MZK52086.1 DUF4432 family protein [Clostridium beijerinckii]MZK60227.1 DUF4432 family protein [Clostridium beijerinckii]MZK70512.1 DUF4432 family protein [Clostridium beijerinckii]MZK75814.1 DUF4432 family protein [Clostridium beijerinckii]
MKNNMYIGNSQQICGVEEHRLIGGRGDNMRLFQVRNGKGLEFTISADRCADISRLSYKGDNYGYFSPTGYVSPAYYDDKGIGFIKSFTGGFLTTCGLTAVGNPCIDEGQELPLHGTISNTPAEHIYWTEDDDTIVIHATMTQAQLFGDKIYMYRKISCSKEENTIEIEDTIENRGSKKVPCMILYHMNIGYPLLSEESELKIPSIKIEARNEHALKEIRNWNKILEPRREFEEQCYYHYFNDEGKASIYNPDIKKGLEISFDPKSLDNFVEWKMFGINDYVLGLEPGNCTPDGRDVLRKEGTLKYLEPGEKKQYKVNLRILEEK